MIFSFLQISTLISQSVLSYLFLQKYQQLIFFRFCFNTCNIVYLLLLSGVLTSCLFELYFYFLTGGDEPILSYEAVVQQECKLISIRWKKYK